MKNNKTIIYINGRFLTQRITGVQRYAIEVIKELDKLDTNIKFIILAPKNYELQELNLENIEIIKVGKFKGHLWEQISLPLYVIKRRKKSILLNMCNIAPVLFPGYVTIHDIAFKIHPEYFRKAFCLWYRLITRINIKRYKHIFTVSNFSKNQIIKNYRISEKKITVTYCSAEHISQIKENYDIIKKLELENKEFIFALGSKSPHKNHNYIVKSAKINPNLIFVVSGNSNRVFNDDEKLCSCPNLIYTGYITDSELVALYKACKAFILPSLYEGFGIPPLEAATLGCNRILVSNIEVLKEIYENSVNYFNVQSPNYKEALDIQEKETKDILERYKWKKTANKIINILMKEE